MLHAPFVVNLTLTDYNTDRAAIRAKTMILKSKIVLSNYIFLLSHQDNHI
jgi:hypothetical protein